MSSQLEDSNSWIPQIGDPFDARIFSLAEAQSLLPVVRKVTRRAVGDFDPVRGRYRNLLDCDPRKPQLALQYEKIVRLWMTKMARFANPFSPKVAERMRFVSLRVLRIRIVQREPSVVMAPVFVLHRRLRRVQVRQTTMLATTMAIQPTTVIVRPIRPPVS